jgi:hypothetical protein
MQRGRVLDERRVDPLCDVPQAAVVVALSDPDRMHVAGALSQQA